jgi:hypothetical protein
MRVFFLLPAVAVCLCCGGHSMHAQENEAGRLAPASRATQPIQAGNRSGAPLGSDLVSPSDTSAYSLYAPRDLNLGGAPGTLYPPDAVPPTPIGMLAHSEPANPAMVYFTLPHLSGNDLSQADAAIVAQRQQDLIRAATYRGYDLHLSGWLYQQGICPQSQPASRAIAGVPVTPDGPGFILLHFVRREDSRVSSFTAVVPRDSSLPVRTIGIAHGSMEQHQDFLSVDTTGAVVNEAMPPPTLYASLQPFGGWISASACVAELGGAYPHIPNEPSLSSAITIAPSPFLRLGLHGEREVLFTDRIDASHYVVWDEQVSKTGKMLKAHREQFTAASRPVTNPPVPASVFKASAPEPPTRIKPYPPGPVPTEVQ